MLEALVLLGAGALTLTACDEAPQGATPGADAGVIHRSDSSVSDASGAVDAGPRPDAAPVSDAGPISDAGISSGVILDRMVRSELTCAEAQPVTNLAPLSWEPERSLWSLPGGGVFFARRESDGQVASALTISPLSLSGLGVPLALLGIDVALGSAPCGLSFDTGFALVWLEAEDLRFATFTSRGVLATTPKSLLTRPVAGLEYAQVAARTGAFGVVMRARPAPDDPAELLFLRIDPTGTAISAPEPIAGLSAPYTRVGPAVVPTRDGFVVAWIDANYQASRLMVASIGPAGRVEAPPVAIEPLQGYLPVAGGGFASESLSMVEVGGNILLTWAEQEGDGSASPTRSVIRLAHLDDHGALLDWPATLERPTDDVDHVEPQLTVMRDRVALSWASGRHIYVCAGCVPDHRVRVVMLDPLDFTPVSEVLLVDTSERGGMLNRAVAASGTELLFTLDLQQHVGAFPATAAVRCQAP